MFRNLLDLLKANPLIEINKDHIGAAIPENDFSFKLILDHYKLLVDDKILEFYHSMSSCHIEWECNLAKHPEIIKMDQLDTSVNGQINIFSIEKMLEFDKKLSTDIWNRNMSEEERSDLANFRYFDMNDDYTRVGFIIKNNYIHIAPLYFIAQQSEGFVNTGLSFQEYINLMLKYKGYQGWQYNHFFTGSANNKRMLYYLDQLF
jgi:hypothetical protein